MMKKSLVVLVVIALVSVVFIPTPTQGEGVIVHEGTHLEPSDTNTTYNFTGIVQFDELVVKNDSAILNSEEFKASPQTESNQMDINISRWSSHNRRFTANVSSSEEVTFELNNLRPVNMTYTIRVDGDVYTSLHPNEDGNITFTYSDWSEHTFTATIEDPSVQTLEPDVLSKDEAKLRADVDLGGYDSAYLHFEFREDTNTTWNTVSNETVTSGGTYAYTHPADYYGTDYEYRAVLVYENGTQYGDTITILSTMTKMSRTIMAGISLLVVGVAVYIIIKTIKGAFSDVGDEF